MSYTLYTIGYQGWQPEALQAAVFARDALLLDIRFSPASRNVEWSGKRLRERFGDRYSHLRALGNVNYKGGPISLLDYPDGAKAVERYMQQQHVILMCVCPQVEACHRRTVATRLANDYGWEVEDIPLVNSGKAAKGGTPGVREVPMLF